MVYFYMASVYIQAGRNLNWKQLVKNVVENVGMNVKVLDKKVNKKPFYLILIY